MKLLGYLDEVPVYEDPNAPPNTLYFLNDNWQEFERAYEDVLGIKFTRWYRLKRFIRRIVK
jgi:hypothetical protein